MGQLKNNILLAVDLILLLFKVALCVYFTNRKVETDPKIPSGILDESDEKVSDVWNSFVDGVADYWRLLYLLRWGFSVISYFVRFEHENETLFILDLAQAILIFFDVGLCYVSVSKIVREIPPEILEELFGDVWNNFMDGVAKYSGEILGAAGAALLTLGLLGCTGAGDTGNIDIEDAAKCPDGGYKEPADNDYK